MKTSELQGAALDWAVAKCEGKDNDCEVHAGNVLYGRATSGFIQYRPSTDWAQGGPIIERERVGVEPWGTDKTWLAQNYNEAGRILQRQYGPTPLIAAMRCYVASKRGAEIELPIELI
jgi:hypothetical protein